MNKIPFYTFFAGMALLSLASCEKNNLVIGKDVIPPAYVKFNTVTATDTSGTYFIKSNNAPFKIPIGITNVSDKDRTIQFSYSSTTAVQGQQYTAPQSIVIPAGKSLDSLTITGITAGFDIPGRIDTVKIAITGGDVPASPYKHNYNLYLRKYCEVVLDDFAGDFTHSTDAQNAEVWGYYTANITVTSTGPTTAKMMIKNFSAAAFGPFAATDPTSDQGIIINIDYSNPANFTTNIPTQPFYVDGNYGPATIKANGNGTFSSCSNTLTLKYTVTVDAGSFGSFVTVLKR